MNALTKPNDNFFLEGLPAGWVGVDRDEFYITTERPNDTFVQAVWIEVKDCIVQINRYDCDDSDVLVSIRRPDPFGLITSPRLHKSKVEGYIRNNT